jgi:putative SOS response-associated peptidase YedK
VPARASGLVRTRGYRASYRGPVATGTLECVVPDSFKEFAAMCGRFTLHSAPSAIAEAFQLAEVHLFEPRYNIAPSQPVPVIREDPDGRRVLSPLFWGLVPHWSKGPDPSAFINARSETVAAKPAFRDFFRSRRCVIVADGFYDRGR